MKKKFKNYLCNLLFQMDKNLRLPETDYLHHLQEFLDHLNHQE
jgi:hypothetical protein